MKSRHMLLICTVILAFGIICPAAIAQTAAKTNYVPVTTAEEAVERALAYTGFAKLEGLDTKDRKEMVQLTVVRDSTTPFLSDSIEGRVVWRIEMPGLILDLTAYDNEEETAHPKNFTILIDSVSGRLTDVQFSDPGVEAAMFPDAPWQVATRQLKEMTHEEYVGFPNELPNVTLLEALDRGVLGSPIACKRGVAQYVLYTYRGRKSRPVWVVHLHGLPPSMGGITHMRSVVDAVTGKEIRSVNLPSSPGLPEAVDSTHD